MYKEKGEERYIYIYTSLPFPCHNIVLYYLRYCYHYFSTGDNPETTEHRVHAFLRMNNSKPFTEDITI